MKEVKNNTIDLHKAIYHNNMAKFNVLIEKDIYWEYTTVYGENLLFGCNNFEMAQKLIEKGVSFTHLNNENQSALFTVENMDLIEYYLSLNMPYDTLNSSNNNILFYCKHHFEKTKKFIDLGVNYQQSDIRENNLLHFNHNIDTVKYYVQLGLNVNALNKYMMNVVSTTESYRCMKFLLEHGANPNVENYLGQNALFLPSKPTLQKLKLLIKHGGEVFRVDHNGNGLLHLWLDDRKATRYLMDLGLDSYLKNKKNETPRDFAQLKQINTFELIDIENEQQQLTYLLNQPNKSLRKKI
jgi:hypothetical protein